MASAWENDFISLVSEQQPGPLGAGWALGGGPSQAHLPRARSLVPFAWARVPETSEGLRKVAALRPGGRDACCERSLTRERLPRAGPGVLSPTECSLWAAGSLGTPTLLAVAPPLSLVTSSSRSQA